MARESKHDNLRGVTIRVPDKLYKEYKEVLAQRGAIVTYDLRLYMQRVVDESKKEEKKV
ncbi:hypothetical protein NSS69_12010 [Macrococcus sp. FSL W8-0367]